MPERNVMSLQVDRDTMARYIYWSGFWGGPVMVVLTFGIAPPFFLARIPGRGNRQSRLRAARFSAELTSKRVRITDRVGRRVVKSIPLDRITDAAQSRGILERRFGVRRLLIRTAGGLSRRLVRDSTPSPTSTLPCFAAEGPNSAATGCPCKRTSTATASTMTPLERSRDR